MADKVTLAGPLCEVVMADGAVWQVQVTNGDMVAWDTTRLKQRPIWPPADQAQIWWLTFIGWKASRREGFTTLEFEPFMAANVSVRNADDDDASSSEGEAPGGPTPPGPEPG